MFETNYILDADLAPYVNCILSGQNSDQNAHVNVPIFADGFPGIMFQKSENGFYLLPRKKRLSTLFLYGQTIDPISLDVKGKHEFLVIQLYPFASKYLLNIDPKALNDECYDLLQLDYINMASFQAKLEKTTTIEEQLQVISDLMRELIAIHQVKNNDRIEEAISIILAHNGQIKISAILDQIHLTERTLERNFKEYVGLSPKQFAKIIQFQTSFNKITEQNFETLLDVGFDSGFSDQSHFIKSFKQYTGQPPSFFINQTRQN